MTQTSNLRGAARLATDAALGAARVAEGVHQSVWGSMGFKGGKRAGQTGGLTGLIYQAVRGTTALVGSAADRLLLALEPVAELAQSEKADSPVQLAILAALNGVMGDRLAASANPLATTMALRHRGRVISVGQMPSAAQVTPKVAVLIHGLCMNDLQWEPGDEPGMSAALAALGYTPIHLRYNTGLHTSQNGELLATQLKMLAENWPTPVEQIALVAHSMGGLISRSALALGAGSSWLPLVKRVVFLGTPHHGAPLERAGQWVDVLLGTNPYSRPFRRLAQLRSAGITDLRHGHTQAADWEGRGRFSSHQDHRQHLPLPKAVQCYAVAGTLTAAGGLMAEQVLGDGLVPLQSALGQHGEAGRNLGFKKRHQYIAHDTGHIALMHSPQVRDQVLQWLQ